MAALPMNGTDLTSLQFDPSLAAQIDPLRDFGLSNRDAYLNAHPNPLH